MKIKTVYSFYTWEIQLKKLWHEQGFVPQIVRRKSVPISVKAYIFSFIAKYSWVISLNKTFPDASIHIYIYIYCGTNDEVRFS